MSNIPLNVRANGGPFDLVLSYGSAIAGFRIDNPSQKRQITSTAPRFRIGTDSAFADEAFSQFLLHGMENGEDKDTFEDGDHRYSYQDGKVSAHHADYLSLASQWNLVDAGIVATARQIIDFNVGNKFIVLAAGTALRVYDTTLQAWSSKGTFAGNAIQIFGNDQYVFIACGTTDDFWRWDGTSFTQPSAGKKFNCFGWYAGKLYAATGQSLYSSANAGAKWGDAILVGWPTTNIEDMWEAAGLLFLSKPEGFYVYDGTAVSRVDDGKDIKATGNYVGGCEFQGVVYFPKLNTLYKGAGASKSGFSSIQKVTTSMSGDHAKEQYGHGTPKRVISAPGAVYIAFDDGEGVYPEVLRYDGIGNHQIYRGASGDTMQALGYSPLTGWLVLNDGSTRIKRVINAGDGEYSDYALTGTIVTSWYDAGFPDAGKAWRSISGTLENMSATETVTIGYYLDDGAAVTVGTLSENGPFELVLGGIAGQVRGKKIKFFITMARSASDITLSPRLKFPLIIRGLVAPNAVYARELQVILDETQPLYFGFGKWGDKYTTVQAREFLEDAVNTSGTISMVDEFGRVSAVRITDDSEAQVRVSVQSEDVVEKAMVSLRVLDMFPGLRRQIDSWVAVSGAVSTSAGSSGFAYGSFSYGAFTYG